MTVRVEGELSTKRPVNAGAPQGSVLGCFLFNMGVDDLEEGFNEPEPEDHQRDFHDETHGRTDDFPATSTPVRVREPSEITMSPMQPTQRPQFEILPRVANVPHWVHKPKDPKIKMNPIRLYKFVDDGINSSSVNMRKAKLLVEEGVFFKEVVDIRTEALLNHIAENAQTKGMRINAKKTSIMCISAASSFNPRIRAVVQNQTVIGLDSMKILVVTLNCDGSFRSHVEDLRSKLRRRTWALAKLRKKGLAEEKLIRCYKALIRPVVEYASPVWHSSITSKQSEKLERQQGQALKNIYGVGQSLAKMRVRADIPSLRTRRENACLKFITKCQSNQRCRDWFQEKEASVYPRRQRTRYPRYHERTARTDRFRNSPKTYLIRLLNNAV